MAFSFTEGQKKAIETRGRSLLVSAAAGSGKTRVLTERVLAYVTDPEDPVDIDRFLIISYTRAAAGEMRSRIMDSIAAAAAADPSDRRLRRQQDKCWQAKIGTIHSICAEILREHCHHLGLAPAFRVIDEDRAEKTKAAVLDRLLESRYEKAERHPGFTALADTVGAGRDDRRLVEATLRLYEKIRSHPYPPDWIEEQKAALDSLGSLGDASETVWGRLILEDIESSARYWAQKMDEAVLEIHAADEKIIKAYGGVFLDDAAMLNDFLRALGEGWDRAREFLPPESFAPLGRLVRYENPELKDRMKAVRDGYKKAAALFRKTLAESSQKQLRDMQSCVPAMKALLELCGDFDRAYAAEKRRESLVDFSDLEHMTLELLVDKATGKATWIAVELSQRFREIMVDEYQDVNAVQDMIFRALSREGKNLFMVGDVKQSIYRFRLADPGIFLEKYESYADEGEDDGPRRILLQENFRSRRAVLDSANHVFYNIMSRELGEMNYDGDAALRYGAPDYPEGSDVPVELCLIDPISGSEDEESPEKTELEARFIAERILKMMAEGCTVQDKDGPRRCRWGDFALLMRSPGGKGSIFHTELLKAGIPVRSGQAGGFFSALEVSVAIDMLAVIDNPHADVPLISVLRSPAFGFSADELAAIRAADKSGDFFGALLAAAEAGNRRCRDFVGRLERIRSEAPDLSLDALLWRVYNDTGLFAVCSAMSGGDERRSRLMQLFELARSFEETGYRGLFRFVGWLRRMAERGQEPQRSAEGEAVSIMSIHKSKGLEFPFVFLCDLAHRFNKNDAREQVLIHSALGLGPKITDTRRGLEYPSLARRAIERQLEKESLSEEMRVLYVAMTRARERLIMSGVQKNAGEKFAKLRNLGESPLPPAVLRSAASPLQWLESCAALEDSPVAVSILSSDRIGLSEEKAAEESAPAPAAAAADAGAAEYIRRALEYSYPHAGAVELPTKLSATEMRKYEGDAEAAEMDTAPPEFEFRYPEPGGGTLSAAARGTAAHAFLQHAELSAVGSREEIEAQLSTLAERGLLSGEEAKAVDAAAMLRFFRSETGRLILSAEKLHREFRFTLLRDGAEVFGPGAAGEELLMQGVIDCLIEEEDGLIIIDYKTDRVSPEGAGARGRLYESQLRAYAQSAERIFGKPVKRRLLHFLRAGVSLEL